MLSYLVCAFNPDTRNLLTPLTSAQQRNKNRFKSLQKQSLTHSERRQNKKWTQTEHIAGKKTWFFKENT